MAKVQFKSLPLRNPSLFPQDIFEKIPQNHPVRLVNEVVDNLDIAHIIKQYKGGGTTSFHPKMMIKVLFFAYLKNIYSCRKIEKALQENIYFMWLSGNSTPDYRTINYFRGKRLKDHIQKLFGDVVLFLHELNYVSLDVQYVDGTKIESASGRYTFVWKGSVEKNKAKLEIKIKSVLTEIESQIKEDQNELNKEETSRPIDSKELRTKLTELNNKLKDSNNKAIKKQIRKIEEEHLPRLEKYEEHIEILGDRNSYSKTDEDAVFMRLKDDHMQNGQLKPAYNTQISTENQFITHYSIHQTAGDSTTLASHLNSFEQQYGKQSKEVVADAGYGSEQNYELMERKQIDAYVKYNYFHKEQKRTQKQNPFLVLNLYYNGDQDYYVCPMGQKLEHMGKGRRKSTNGFISEVDYYQAKRCQGCPLRGMCHKSSGNKRIEINHKLNQFRAKARERLTSNHGLYHRSKRPIEVEAVFGQLKSNNKFSRFTLRKMDKVNIEFGLMSIGHNLRKLAQKALNKHHFLFFYNQDGLLKISMCWNLNYVKLYEDYQSANRAIHNAA